MSAILTVCDRSRRAQQEAAGIIDSVVWRLNDVGQAIHTEPYADAGSFWREGSPVVIEFSADLDLPAWGGILSKPTWRDGKQFNIAGIEKNLSWRYTTSNLSFSAATRGEIAEGILGDINAQAPTLLTADYVDESGDLLTLEFDYAEGLYSIQQLTDSQDYLINTELAAGTATYTLNWYATAGFDKTNDVLLMPAENNIDVWEPQQIYNFVRVIGSDGTTVTASDAQSAGLYGRREHRVVYLRTTDEDTLQSHADALLDRYKMPRKYATVRNVQPPFSDIRVGNTVWLTAYARHPQHAIDGEFRIIAMEWQRGDTLDVELREVL